MGNTEVSKYDHVEYNLELNTSYKPSRSCAVAFAESESALPLDAKVSTSTPNATNKILRNVIYPKWWCTFTSTPPSP